MKLFCSKLTLIFLILFSMQSYANKPEVTPENYIQVKTTPYGNKELSYTFLAPKGFKSIEVTSNSKELSDKKLTPLGNYYTYIKKDNQNYLANILVQGIQTKSILKATEIVEPVLLFDNASLKDLKSISENTAIAYIEREIENQSYVEYTKIKVFGNKHFFIQCLIPKILEKEYTENICGVAMQTFHMMELEKEQADVEKGLQPDKIKHDILDRQIELSSAWKKKEVSGNENQGNYVDFTRSNNAGNIELGWFRIRQYPKTQLSEFDNDKIMQGIIQTISNELEKLEYTIKEVSKSQDSRTDDFNAQELIVYNMQDKKNADQNQLGYLAITETDKYWFGISLMTPSQLENTQVWANNTNTLKKIISDLTQ